MSTGVGFIKLGTAVHPVDASLISESNLHPGARRRHLYRDLSPFVSDLGCEPFVAKVAGSPVKPKSMAK